MGIELKEVSKHFGGSRNRKVAVNRVSWRAEPGEIFGLLGPNGAGKTTMIRMILDLLRPDSGEIWVEGGRHANRSDLFKSRIGYLPEERGLYKHVKARELLTYFARLKGLGRRAARERVDKMLDDFKLAGSADKRVSSLSKGMSQALQIGCCLVHDPDLLILDEPFYGLDPVNVVLIRETILSLKARGKLIILCTHMMSEAEALCDRISITNRGEVVIAGSLAEIRRRHASFDLLLDDLSQTDGLSCVERTTRTQRGQGVLLQEGRTICDFMAEMAARGRSVQKLEEARMPLEDIFVSIVKERDGLEQ